MPSFRQAFSPFFLKKLFDPRHVLDCTAQLDYGFADTNCAIRSTGRHGRRGGPPPRAGGQRENGETVPLSLTRWNIARLSCSIGHAPQQEACPPKPRSRRRIRPRFLPSGNAENCHRSPIAILIDGEIPLSSPETTHHKPVKLATKSAHASYFMPMLQSLADKDELNEVVKNCVVKSCELMDARGPSSSQWIREDA